MSFFCELFDCFKIDDMSKYLSISMILGVGLVIVGNFKIVRLEEENIIIDSKNKEVSIEGKSLSIKSVSKGELIINGNVTKICLIGEENGHC